MSIETRPAMREAIRHELEVLQGQWGWYLALGIALVVMGTFALIYTVAATVAAVLAYGIILLVAGLTEAIGAFWTRRWSGFFLHLLAGVMYAVVGLMFLKWPGAAMIALTLLLGSVLLVAGVFRIVASLYYRFPSWGWSLLNGVITFALGAMIWAGWPASSLFIIGIFLGVELLFAGISWVMLAMTLKNLPQFGGRPKAAVATP